MHRSHQQLRRWQMIQSSSGSIDSNETSQQALSIGAVAGAGRKSILRSLLPLLATKSTSNCTR